MTSKPIIVLAGLRVKDGSADDFIKLATPIVAATRKEPGCVKYEFLQDVLDKQIFYFTKNTPTKTRIKPTGLCRT